MIYAVSLLEELSIKSDDIKKGNRVYEGILWVEKVSEFSLLMYSTVLLCRLGLLYEIVSYYGLERCKLPHNLIHFNTIKVSEFNVKNEMCAGRSPGQVAQLLTQCCPHTPRLQVSSPVRTHIEINQWAHK